MIHDTKPPTVGKAVMTVRKVLSQTEDLSFVEIQKEIQSLTNRHLDYTIITGGVSNMTNFGYIADENFLVGQHTDFVHECLVDCERALVVDTRVGRFGTQNFGL